MKRTKEQNKKLEDMGCAVRVEATSHPQAPGGRGYACFIKHKGTNQTLIRVFASSEQAAFDAAIEQLTADALPSLGGMQVTQKTRELEERNRELEAELEKALKKQRKTNRSTKSDPAADMSAVQTG